MKRIYLPLLCAFLLSCTPTNGETSVSSSTSSDTTVSSESSESEETSVSKTEEGSSSTSESEETSEESSSLSEESEPESNEPIESSEESEESSPIESETSEHSEESTPIEGEDPDEEESSSIEEPPIEESSEESYEESSPEDGYYHAFTLNSSNGKITGSYQSTETVNSTAKDDEGGTFKVGYKMCMGSTNTGDFQYAQMKKNEGVLYSLSTRGDLKRISVYYSSSSTIKIEALDENGRGITIADKAASQQEYQVPSGYGYFKISAGSGAVYVGYISLVYSSEDVEIEPPVESSSEESITTGGDISIPSISSIDPSDYYGQVGEEMKGQTLKTRLHQIIDNHTNKGYDYAYTAYKTTDVDSDGKIIDTYSAYRYDPDSDHQGAPGKSNYNAEGQMFNREHTIPQSVFNEGSPMKADLHHLLPTDAYVNNKRGNYPHAEVSSATYTSTNQTKVGPSATEGYNGTACEVPDQYKGDFARIYFYMVTRYEDVLPNWKSYAAFDGKSFPGLSSWAIDLYLKWSDEDPVSDKEIFRNEAVYSIQNNRNPFIDHPEYAHMIWDQE